MLVDGLLVVDKPPGMTSRRVVTSLSRLIGVPKAGHAGTLDPLATGVLLVTLGRATLLTRFLSGDRKEYYATALLGVETDTYDLDGKVVREADASAVGEEDVLEALGEIALRTTQYPPLHSAVKQGGKPLYHYARQGIGVSPRIRSVDIGSLELGSLADGERGPEAHIVIECAAGTYVRSVVQDLGRELGVGACVTALRRTRSGAFGIEDAGKLEALVTGGRPFVLSKMLSMEQATEAMPTVRAGDEGADAVSKGVPLRDFLVVEDGRSSSSGEFRVLGPDGRLLAIYGPARKSDDADVIGRAVRVLRPAGKAGADEVA